MLLRNTWKETRGFTVIELSVSIVLIGIATLVLYGIFGSTSKNYFSLQQDSVQFNSVAFQTQRIAAVVRGLTDITEATSTTLKFYAYFSPNDSYVSFLHYRLEGAGPSLLADVTPMDANPPNGNLLTAQKKTSTIIQTYSNQSGVGPFEYLDAAGVVIPQPIADLNTIKGVRITLAQQFENSQLTDIHKNSVTVSLRNRKTNL